MGRAPSLALAALIAVSACGAKPRPAIFGEQMPASCAGEVNIEECAGWFVDRVLAMSQGTYADERITSYVASIGGRLAKARGDHPWKFIVSDDTEVQAYAGLSKTIFINRGALVLLRDEAELAAVLGHEMAHVLGGHLHENYREVFQEGDVGRSTESEKHADRYARDDEIQADEVAVLMLAKAGYDPTAVERMLRALAATSPTDGEKDTEHHPRWIERIARVQALAAVQPKGETGEARYRERMAELVVGNDPRVAAIIGNALVFAHTNVAIDLPPHQKAEVDGADITVEIDSDTGFGVRAIDSKFASALQANLDEKPDNTFVILIRPKVSLMIAVVGSDAALVAKRIRESVRAPRPEELRAIKPTRIDLSAPRALWQP